MYSRILKTVNNYYLTNKEVLSKEQINELEEQLTWLSDMCSANGESYDEDYDREREMAIKELIAYLNGVRDNYTLTDFDGKYDINGTPVYGVETNSLIFKIWDSNDPKHNFPHAEATENVINSLLEDGNCDGGDFSCGFWLDTIMWEIKWK